MDVEIHRYAAFTDTPDGGNPAGVVVTPAPLDAARMQEIAAEVGYSETAFLVPSGDHRWDVRYFAPVAEVPFCGHATIASGVYLGVAGLAGQHVFVTAAGDVPVAVDADGDQVTAALTSVPPKSTLAPTAFVHEALKPFGWPATVLDSRYPPAIADAGARHLILVLRDRGTLGAMTYDFDALRELMERKQLTTVALLWQEADDRWHARNAFPVGGVVEDPATGAAAAAFGAYLRANGDVTPPATITIVQGESMGRPSQIRVDIPPCVGGITVSGAAISLD